jgi:hypothetical protein
MPEPAGRAPDRCCAAGQPLSPAKLGRLARAHGGEPGAMLAELAGADVLAFAADGQIRAAYPFSPAPTPIRVSWQAARHEPVTCRSMMVVSVLVSIRPRPAPFTSGHRRRI